MIYWFALLTAAGGWLLLPRRLRAAGAAGLSLGFLWASFLLSLELFFFDLLGAGWNFGLLAALPAAALGGALYRRRGAIELPSFKLTLTAALGIAGVLVPLAVWLPAERIMPLTSQSWDAWAIWLFKAKAFYLDGGVRPYLERSAEFIGQPGYPLLTPLYAAFFYIVNGGVDDQAAKFLSPCYWLALIGTTHYLARRIASPAAAAAAAVMVAWTPMVSRVAFDLAGYADTALSAYFVAAAGFLYLWLRDGAEADLAAGSLAAAAAAWTKNEGQLFLLAFAGIAAAGLIRRRAGVKGWLIVLAPAAAVLAPWQWLRATHGVEAAGFTLAASFEAGLFSRALGTLASKAFSLTTFNLSFFLLPLAAAGAALLRAPAACWALPALVVWQLGGALLAYSTGRNDLDWWLETSADRILTQLAPLAVLFAAAVFSLWSETAAADAAAAETERAPKSPPKRAPRRGRRG